MKRLLPFLLLGLAFTGWWAYRRWTADDAARIAGVFEARTIEVGSLVGGRVKTVDSEAGRRVAAGGTLLTLETDLVDLEIAQQKARVAQGKKTASRSLLSKTAKRLFLRRCARRSRETWSF